MSQLSANPASVTSADALPLTVFQKRARIRHIEFTGYNLDTDNFTLTDVNGKLVWTGNGEADLSPVRSGPVGDVTGLIVTVLTAGTLLIYFT